MKIYKIVFTLGVINNKMIKYKGKSGNTENFIYNDRKTLNIDKKQLRLISKNNDKIKNIVGMASNCPQTALLQIVIGLNKNSEEANNAFFLSDLSSIL